MLRHLRFRWPAAVYPVMVASLLIAVIWALAVFSTQTQNVSSLARHERDCVHSVNEYSRSLKMRQMPGRITAIVPHYNEGLHRCLVEISCENSENGRKSLYDQVVDAKTDEEIGSRSRTIDEHSKGGTTVITGAPVRLDDEAGAQKWFNGLMQ